MFETGEICPNLIYLPTPQNIRVSFERGITTPTLGFDPADDPEFYYQIGIFDKDYSRHLPTANPSPKATLLAPCAQ